MNKGITVGSVNWSPDYNSFKVSSESEAIALLFKKVFGASPCYPDSEKHVRALQEQINTLTQALEYIRDHGSSTTKEMLIRVASDALITKEKLAQ